MTHYFGDIDRNFVAGPVKADIVEDVKTVEDCVGQKVEDNETEELTEDPHEASVPCSQHEEIV